MSSNGDVRTRTVDTVVAVGGDGFVPGHGNGWGE